MLLLKDLCSVLAVNSASFCFVTVVFFFLMRVCFIAYEDFAAVNDRTSFSVSCRNMESQNGLG